MHSSNDDIHRILANLASQDRHGVLAVVLATDGSTPGKVGAKAIVAADGSIQGTIGGGRTEAEVQRLAVETLKTRCAVVLDFQLDGSTADGDDAICGGRMRVLLDPTADRHREAYEAALASRQSRQRGVLLTSARGDKEVEVTVEFLPEQTISSQIGFPGLTAVRTALQREQPRWYVQESTSDAQTGEVLIEPVTPTPVLLIVGGGHVGQAVAAQAQLVGFDIVVIDDRPEFTCPERFPDGALTDCGDIGERVADFPHDADTYVVIVTRGHRHDADALAACICQPVAYIGMIGSRRKVAMMRKHFVESGRATSTEFDRVYAPIGLDLAAVTVPEIATSIVSQLIAVRRKSDSLRIPTS